VVVVVAVVVVSVVVSDVGSVNMEDASVVVVVLAVVDSVTVDAVVERDVAVTVIASTLVVGFAGAIITNFNSKARVMAEIARMMKVMEMIQQHDRRLGRSLFSVSLPTYTRFLCILCFKRTLNLIKI
jgi:hypothetical protein